MKPAPQSPVSTLERVQRLLTQQGRIRGPKLQALLETVQRIDLAAAILKVHV